MKEIAAGAKREITAVVTEEMLAVNVGSGGLRVLATPALAALMEKAAFELLEEDMPQGITTVGTMLELRHIRATPFSDTVSVCAELTDVADRKYTFRVTAKDSVGVISEAVHERFSVNAKRFMEKAENNIAGDKKS